MNAIKGFWQHKNGKVYAIKSDTFGNILGGVGPLESEKLQSLDSYDYKPAIVDWLKDAISKKLLRRINPAPC